MVNRNAFGMMMVATGDADAFITGVYSRYSEVTKLAEQIIGIRPSYNHFGAMNIVTCKKGTFFIADTLINRHPSTEVLIDVARLTNDAVKFFATDPVIAMPILQSPRYSQILENRSSMGAQMDLSTDFVKEMLKEIHEESIRQQMIVMNEE